jgi:hypothetical protein
VVDCWKLAEYHGLLSSSQKQASNIGILFFASILGKQLIDFSSKVQKQIMFAPSNSSGSQLFLLPLFKLHRAPIFHQ